MDDMLYIGLGSNIGVREHYLLQACKALVTHPDVGLTHIKTSFLYETPALLPENAPEGWNRPYLNQVIAGITKQEDPHQLLKAFKSIEQSIGRHERGHWGPREIDLDMLAWGERTVHTPTLKLPHPNMLERDFVMVPLASISPFWVHPVTGEKAMDIAAELRSLSQIKRYHPVVKQETYAE